MSKILLVDDNENNRLTLELLLEDIEGIEILEAVDGQEAIDICKENEFDLIFMDIMMPNVDGFEATQTIKEAGSKAMIIALSALDDENSKNKMLALGAEDYLTKPINAELFMMRVKNYLSIVEKRFNRVFHTESLNPFSKNVYSRTINFRICEQKDLAEFWDYWLDTKSNVLDLSDCVRIIYGLGLWLLKQNKKFYILSEENDEQLYMIFVGITGVKKSIVTNILLKHYEGARYVLKDDMLTFQLLKIDLLSLEKEKETVTISDTKKEILQKTHIDTISANDYVNETAISLMNKIDGLEEINNDIDEEILKFETNISIVDLHRVCENFGEYVGVLHQLDAFEHLAFALETLMNFLSSITQEQLNEDKVKNLSSMLLNLLHDLESWRQNVFILQNARDIHYLDASLLSSCIQMEAVFDDKEVGEDDGGDLEFF
jgi:two-component system chemotaxis response regulator CheY